jgi:hypothetical protein
MKTTILLAVGGAIVLAIAAVALMRVDLLGLIRHLHGG